MDLVLRGSIGEKYGVIVLNQEIKCSYFMRIYKNAMIRCCADGGANRLVQYCLERDIPIKEMLPSFVHGDLDSLDEGVRVMMECFNVPVEGSKCQDTTDLSKCLIKLEKQVGRIPVWVIGGHGGRFDQTMACIQTLHLFRDRRIYLYAFNSVTFYLEKGSHTVEMDPRLQGPSIGIIPFLPRETRITTKGLEWDLSKRIGFKVKEDDSVCGFGGLISTSNRLKKGHTQVHIAVSEGVVWTVEIQDE